ncbi:helix-turn-helix transcriptional regulator [Actinospica robiniae]|uniref:helix-turn-helix transcriptional regulator n=1 Tax=Actinospica robiniae TaxID=304901 RepID=UPI0012FCD96D|nr:helix-turn-helix domain-containing protein [Actinospica robiniae]
MTSRTTPPSPNSPSELPPVVNVVTAAAWLGVGRTTAYRLAANGTFPVPVLRIGTSLRVPTAPLLRLLDIEPSTAAPREERLDGPDYSADHPPADDGAHGETATAAEPPDPDEEPRRRPLRRVPRWSVDRARTR